MLSGIKNKLEDFARKRTGREVVDRELTAFLEEKYKDNLEDRNDAMFEILSYLDGLELRAEHLQNKTALDLGSSQHFFDEYCKKKYNTDFIALDVEQESLGSKHELGVVADARALPFKNEAFDLVVSHASMPHLFTPLDDDNYQIIPIEGEVKKQTMEDVLAVFKEAYRVLKPGGHIRMSTFSEAEIHYDRKTDAYKDIILETEDGGKIPLDVEATHNQQMARVAVIKEVLDAFEQESGARCMFKDEKRGGLIIITKG